MVTSARGSTTHASPGYDEETAEGRLFLSPSPTIFLGAESIQDTGKPSRTVAFQLHCVATDPHFFFTSDGGRECRTREGEKRAGQRKTRSIQDDEEDEATQIKLLQKWRLISCSPRRTATAGQPQRVEGYRALAKQTRRPMTDKGERTNEPAESSNLRLATRVENLPIRNLITHNAVWTGGIKKGRSC